MYQVLPESSGNVIGFKVIGDLDSAEYKELFDLTDKLIAQHGRIRVLSDLREYKALHVLDAISALPKRYQDAHFVDKKAVISDDKWIHAMTNFTAPFHLTKIKLFRGNEIDKAWEWIRE